MALEKSSKNHSATCQHTAFGAGCWLRLVKQRNVR